MLPYITRRKHAGRECVSAVQLCELEQPALGAVFGWNGPASGICWQVPPCLTGPNRVARSKVQDGRPDGVGGNLCGYSSAGLAERVWKSGSGHGGGSV